MIKGIGNDIIEINRIEEAIKNKKFLEKFFTQKENILFESRNYQPQTIAGNFAVKEAVAKVLGTGFVGFSPIDIEVLRDEKGKPYVTLYNKAKEIASDINITDIYVSISHSKSNVVAVAVSQ